VVPTGFSRMPAGPGGSVGTLGGTGTAISLRSTHRQEAIALLRFQLRALMQANGTDYGAVGPAETEFSDTPSVSPPPGLRGRIESAREHRRPALHPDRRQI
jgi:hypothetical protein